MTPESECLAAMSTLPDTIPMDVKSDVPIKYESEYVDKNIDSQFSIKPRKVGIKQTMALEEAAQALINATLNLEESFLLLCREFPDFSVAEPIISKVSEPLQAARISAVDASTVLEEAILIWKRQFSTSFKSEPNEEDYEDMGNDELPVQFIKSENVKVECKEIDSEEECNAFACNLCDFSTQTRKELKIHKATECKGKLKCTECDYSTEKRKQLAIHMRRKHQGETNPKPGEKLQCKDCDYITGRAKNMRRHRAARHEGIRFNCDQCDYSALWKSNLDEHKSTKHLGIRYKCEQCDYTATLRRNLRNHVKMKHGVSETEYTCNFCPFSTKTCVEDIKCHIAENHADKSDDQFNSKKVVTLQKAIKRSPNPDKPKPEPQKYYCDKCEYTSTKLMYFNVHVESKHEGAVFTCDQCPFTTGSRLSLSSHKKRHNDVFYCDQCEYSTSNKLLLKSHTQTKHEKVMINCDECDFKTTVKYYLTKHKKKMHQINKYQCDKCNFTACYPSDLRIHINAVHMGVKFACDQCEFTTRRTGDLNKHKRIVHEGVRYNCQYCSYTATQNRFLEEHMKMKHGDHEQDALHHQDSSMSLDGGIKKESDNVGRVDHIGSMPYKYTIINNQVFHHQVK